MTLTTQQAGDLTGATLHAAHTVITSWEQIAGGYTSADPGNYFFFLPSSGGMSFFWMTDTTLPSMTAVLPSRKAIRERPSQFLNESTTSGCCGTKGTWAISLDLSEWGSSIFLPPVSLPTLKTNLVARHAE